MKDTDNLWKMDTWLNKNIPYLFSTEITEYDMKSAGLSIIKEFKLLDKDKITKLDSMEKIKRNKMIGIYQRDDSDFKENLKKGFIEARRLFFEANDIMENNLLSIKKDAIFTSKICDNQEFGHIVFRPKNRYTSYVYLKTENSNIELYFNPKTLDVKGISDKKIEMHKPYMIKFLNTFFHKMETDTNEDVLRWLSRFVTKYKRKELEAGYYRSFDNMSVLDISDIDTISFVYEDEVVDNVNIEYNYFNILMKLVKIPL